MPKSFVKSRRLVNYCDLQARGIEYSREHLRRLEAAGKFPERLRLSPCRVAWYERDIDRWLSNRPRGQQTDPSDVEN